MSKTPSEFKQEIAEINKHKPDEVMSLASTKNAMIQIFGMDKGQMAITKEALYFKELMSGQNAEKLKQCSALSIQSAVLTLFSDDLSLSPSLQECTIVPIFNTKLGIMLAKPWVMYSGRIKMLCQARAISHVKCNEVVYEGDIIMCTNGVYTHTKNFSRPDNAQRIGVLLIAVLPNGQERHVWLDKVEIAKRRNVSKSQDRWDAWPDQYWKKTAIHELFKYLPKSKMVMDIKQKFENEELEEYQDNGGEIIEATHQVIVPNEEQQEPEKIDQDPILIQTLSDLISEHGNDLMNKDQRLSVEQSLGTYSNEQITAMVGHMTKQLELLKLIEDHGSKVLTVEQIQNTKDKMPTFTTDGINTMITNLQAKINPPTVQTNPSDDGPPF